MRRAARLTLAATLILGVSGLAACSSEDGAEPTPDPTGAYIAFVRENVEMDLSKATDQQLIELGQSYCKSLDAGIPVAGVLATARESFDELTSVTTVRAAIVNLCPQHLDESASPAG